MPSCSQQEACSSQLLDGNLVTEEEDEEEDVDFNPFLKETSSPEASSSLSSDDEGLGANGADNVGVGAGLFLSLSLNSIDGNQYCTENEEEVVTQQEESESGVPGRPMKRKSTSLSMEKNTSRSGNDFVEDVSKGVSTDPLCSINDTMEFDDEDAICRRTRARYSLASFSLDELENFLQETDDEDWQNVDDEQEYRKFLGAVLQGGDCQGQSIQENGDDEDEDEDSDADFDIEIEEALDSDLDENMRGKENRAQEAGGQAKTRQNNHSKKFLGQANRPLRPLLPIVSNAVFPPLPGFDRPTPLPNSPFHCTPSSQAGLVNAFTPHQIGQLHCLIHEHTQLLVQVFSLCVLDPSRQQIADETRRLISELVHKRDKVLSWRKVPYPDFCFRPPYVHSSVSDELPKSQSLPFPVASPSSGREKEVLGTKPVSHSSSSSGGRCNDGGHVDSLQTTKDSLWVPPVNSPVLSILDAAPLGLLSSYMDDVSRAVQVHRKRQTDALYDTPFEKKPLFPLFITPTSPAANSEALRGTTSPGPTTASSSLNGHPPPKKTLAASLVESTKKQSIAFVPKDIVSLAQRFYPLFNPALYPRKSPPQAVANRVLFTDTEDELLAMGMMEYNTDWKSIQQRFLPCKSKHQIFVRQKNRCSSKAPDNPIKAVRRMKTSPLTAEEIDRIHKGLKVFRLDWMSVWRFLVPYRDPSLLSRQWRVALGTQKSYKKDAAKKEKRRISDMQRKLRKAAASINCQTASEKEDNNAVEGNRSENDNMEDEDEAYVHEAFLADWRPGNSENHEFLSLSPPQHLQSVSQFTHVRYSASYTMASNPFTPDCLSQPSKSQVTLRPRRAPRQKDAQLVKLAPELPPVNLPPSVRVISQSAFKSYHSATSHSTKISSSGTTIENLVPRLAPVAKPGATVSANSGSKGCTPSSQSSANICQEDPRVHSDQFVSEDNCADTDLQMHPLLLQAPEDGPLPCRPVNSNTFNFISGNQLQANFSNFCKPSDAGSIVDGFYTPLSSKNPSNSCAIDFHPLLQRKDDGNITQLRISSDPVMIEPHVTSRPQAATSMPASPREMANELDLEIHLSSIPRNVTTSRKAAGHEYNGSRNSLLNFGILKETNKANSSSQERSKNRAAASLEASPRNQGHVSGGHKLGLSNHTSRTVGYVGDQSLPEIVMEQEELSDSEEENGEDVEFECEEMDDSEREESDCG